MKRQWAVIAVAIFAATSHGNVNEPEEVGTSVDTLSAIEGIQGSRVEPVSLRSIFPFWYEPAEPFRVIGSIYFVGTRGLSMFFIPTSEGHILIDGGVPENAPMVANSIRKLGYRPEDIAILLNTHAHVDHSGGLAELKALSGAKLIASEGDRSALEGGFLLGSEDSLVFQAPPVGIDRIIEDSETLSLGGVSLSAHMTPGHTRGCTSWKLSVTEADRTYNVLVFCSASVSVNQLVNPPQYPDIVEDYRRTFKRVVNWRPDVFLANHPEFFDLETKRKRLEDGDPLAFVDANAFSNFIVETEYAFEDALKKQYDQTIKND